MINWMYYPRNSKAPDHIIEVVNGFEAISKDIDSEKLGKKEQLSSNGVLEKLEPFLTSLGYDVEKSKAAEDKIRIPVYYGKNGTETVAYEVDAYLDSQKTVLEVEAGQATINYKFLKDFYEALYLNSRIKNKLFNWMGKNGSLLTEKAFFLYKYLNFSASLLLSRILYHNAEFFLTYEKCSVSSMGLAPIT